MHKKSGNSIDFFSINILFNSFSQDESATVDTSGQSLEDLMKQMQGL